MEDNDPRLSSHGKRAIANLDFDPSGLRTTKTVTWDALNKVLEKGTRPDHLPFPSCGNEWETIVANRVAKGLPEPIGTRLKFNTTQNYNSVRW